MRVRLLLFTVAIALIVGAPATAATLPHRTLVGPAQGVQASLSGTRVTIRFIGASAAWGKQRAGRTAAVSCEATPEPGLLFRGDTRASGLGNDAGFGDGSPSEDLDLEDLGITKLSPSGASVSAKVRDVTETDLCEVRAGSASSADSAWAVLTPRGAIALEEQQRGLRMTDVAYAAAPKGTYRAAADVVALGGGEVVALDDPNGTPPAGKIGYWSKGRAMSLISASATGRRLALQDLGGGMLRTNAFEALLMWTPAEAPERAADPSSSLLVDDDELEEEQRYEAGEGVYAHLEGGEVVFRFTGKAAKAYRAIAGRRVTVTCMKAPERPLLGGALEVGGTPSIARVRVPAHGGTIRAKAPAGRDDLCAVKYEGHEVAFGLLTPAGRRYLVDFVAPLAVLFDDRTPWDIAPAQATRYPGVATVLASHPGVVGLPTQGAVLAAGKTGVWTDADHQATIVFSGPDGLRYVLADQGDGVVRTNLFTTFLSVMAAATTAPAGPQDR